MVTFSEDFAAFMEDVISDDLQYIGDRDSVCKDFSYIKRASIDHSDMVNKIVIKSCTNYQLAILYFDYFDELVKLNSFKDSDYIDDLGHLSGVVGSKSVMLYKKHNQLFGSYSNNISLLADKYATYVIKCKLYRNLIMFLNNREDARDYFVSTYGNSFVSQHANKIDSKINECIDYYKNDHYMDFQNYSKLEHIEYMSQVGGISIVNGTEYRPVSITTNNICSKAVTNMLRNKHGYLFE